MEFPTSPGPWTFGYTDDLQTPIIIDANDDVVCVMHEGVTTKAGKLLAAAPMMHYAMKRYLPLLERLENGVELWANLTDGLGIATLNGYRAAIARAAGK